jgi:hypothetical protein
MLCLKEAIIGYVYAENVVCVPVKMGCVPVEHFPC